MTGKWALLLLALAWSTDSAAQAWETTDWTVECLTVTEGTCRATEGAGANAYFEDALEGASGWLGGLGFRGPAIEYRAGTDTYMAYISDADNEDAEGKRSSIGVYYPQDAQFYLTSDRYFAMGEGDTPQERADALAFDMKHTGTVVHELFHAVQYSYYRDGNLVRGWITEGMAQAVQIAWLRRSMPHESLSMNPRAFDYPLHKPKDHDETYTTSIFWRSVGKLLGSPDHIGYLDVILEQELGRNWGLGGVDEGLRNFDPNGLYNVYPEFIAGFANNALFFDEVEQVDMVYDDASRVEKSLRATVREVAANAIEVSVNVPVGKTAKLEIELATHHDDLHLIVDDKRLDKATGSARNVFHATVEGMRGDQTFFVRVANVAPRAIDSGERRYLLDFTLMPTTGKSQCIVTATMQIEPLGTYRLYMKDGKKVPIRRTESVVGVATIDDSRHHLALSFEDEQGERGSQLFTVDISSLAIGGPAQESSARGEFGYTSPEKGPYDVQLSIVENADPGDLAGWGEMTLREQIDSGVGFPERLAMRRLRGEFRATRTQAPGCCVGYAQTITGTFDAGNGPYHCEGGLEMMGKAYETMMDMFNDTPERKADPGKLDGLLD